MAQRGGNVEGLSEEALSTSRSVLRRNQGGGFTGLQQFFTPEEAATFISRVVGTSQDVLDVGGAGEGHLLTGFRVGGQYGVEVDKEAVETAAKAGRGYYPLVGDVQGFFPLLKSLGLRWPVVLANPPFSHAWEVSGLGKGSSTVISARMALELVSKDGWVVLITGADRFERELRAEVEKKLVAVVTVEKLFKGVDHVCSIIFLRNSPLSGSRQCPAPLEVTVAGLSALEDSQLTAQVRRVSERRFGFGYPGMALPTPEVWKAIQEEYEERQKAKEKGHPRYLLSLRGSRVNAKLSGYHKLLVAKHAAEDVAWLESLHNQVPSYFALQERTWRRVLALAAAVQVEVQPELLARVAVALTHARAAATPLYPVKDMQRLAYLEDLDSIRCRESDAANGYVAGQLYGISCATKVKEARETREAVGGDESLLKEVIVQRKAMSVVIGGNEFEESAEHLKYILKHFEVPDPGDLGTVFPERVAYWRGIVRQVESEIRQREPAFRFFDFQVEDIARALTKMEGPAGGGSVLGWEQGLGKALGEGAVVRCLEVSGRLPDECALFVMPQDLARQFCKEMERFFGIRVLKLACLARVPGRKLAEGEVSAVELEALVRARRRDLKLQRSGVSLAPRPKVWAVPWYESLAITDRLEEALPELRVVGQRLVHTVKVQQGTGEVERIINPEELAKLPPMLRRGAKQRFVKLMSNTHCPQCRADNGAGWNGRECKAGFRSNSIFARARAKAAGFHVREEFTGRTVSSQVAKQHLPPELAAQVRYGQKRWVGRKQCGYVDLKLKRKPAYSQLLHHLFRVVCVDEATKIKGDDSLISRAVMAMRPTYRLLCTGTPVDDYVMDLFWLLWWVIGDSTPRFPYSYRGGKERFTDDFGVVEVSLKEDEDGNEQKGWKKVLPEASNLLRLWRLLCSSVLRRRMDEVGSVVEQNGAWSCKACGAAHVANVKGPGGRYQKPARLECSACGRVSAALVPLTFNVVPVPWGEKQKQLFGYWLETKNFARYFREKHPDSPVGDKGAERLAACLGQFALLEYAGTFPPAMPEDARRHGASPWTPAVARLLQDAERIIRGGGKILVGSCLVALGPWVAARLRDKGYNVGCIAAPDARGKVKTFSPKERAHIIAEFREGKADGLAAGVEAINLGHNLDMVTDVLMLGLPWRYATLVQYLARARRLSSMRPVTAHLYLLKGSLSWKKWEVLRRKTDSADLVMDGKIMGRRERSVDMLQILAELQRAGARFDGSEVPESEVEAVWQRGDFHQEPVAVRVRRRPAPAPVQAEPSPVLARVESEATPVSTRVETAPVEAVRVRRRPVQLPAAQESNLFDSMAGRFRTFLVDFPWPEEGGGGRGAQNHYKTLKPEAGPGVIRGSGLWLPCANAHAYFWATNNYLKHGIWMMEQLGFRYVTKLTWLKPGQGLGQYFRGEDEVLLFGVRGSGMAPDVLTDRKDLGTAIIADYVREGGRIVHSAKPPESYARVMARSKGPYLELFGRAAPLTSEWTCWGNEVKPAQAGQGTSVLARTPAQGTLISAA